MISSIFIAFSFFLFFSSLALLNKKLNKKVTIHYGLGDNKEIKQSELTKYLQNHVTSGYDTPEAHRNPSIYVNNIIKESNETEKSITDVFLYPNNSMAFGGNKDPFKCDVLKKHHPDLFISVSEGYKLEKKIKEYETEEKNNIDSDFNSAFKPKGIMAKIKSLGESPFLNHTQKKAVLNNLEKYEGYTEKDLEDLHSRIKYMEENLEGATSAKDIDYDSMKCLLEHESLLSDSTETYKEKARDIVKKDISGLSKDYEGSIEHLIKLADDLEVELDDSTRSDAYELYTSKIRDQLIKNIDLSDTKESIDSLKKLRRMTEENHQDTADFLDKVGLDRIGNLHQLLLNNDHLEDETVDDFIYLERSLVDRRKHELMDSNYIDYCLSYNKDLMASVGGLIGSDIGKDTISLQDVFDYSMNAEDKELIFNHMAGYLDMSADALTEDIGHIHIKKDDLGSVLKVDDVKSGLKDLIVSKMFYSIEKDLMEKNKAFDSVSRGEDKKNNNDDANKNPVDQDKIDEMVGALEGRKEYYDDKTASFKNR